MNFVHFKKKKRNKSSEWNEKFAIKRVYYSYSVYFYEFRMQKIQKTFEILCEIKWFIFCLGEF